MRIGIQAPRGIWDANKIKQPLGFAASSLPHHLPVQRECFCDLFANPVYGIEATCRVLEDHRDASATHFFKYGCRRTDQFLPFQHDAASDARLGWQQAKRRQPSDRFAAAAFADKPNRFTLGDRKVDATQGRRSVKSNRKPGEADQRHHAPTRKLPGPNIIAQPEEARHSILRRLAVKAAAWCSVM